jgi:hypothetical protein
MLLQVMMFPFLLILLGGIISLAAIADPHHKRSAPRVGFPILYAGLFSLILSWGLESVGEVLGPQHRFEGFGFIVGYLLGMIGGALLGFRLALRHKRHLIQTTMEVDDAHESNES